MTIGEGDRWNGGAAAEHLDDFGPLRGDATEIPPLWRRGVLYDVPAHRGLPFLGRAEAVSAHELKAIEASTGVGAGAGDVALVRTGYMRHWPDEERMAEHRGPGPRHLGRPPAGGPRRRGHRVGHEDVRGAAGARPRGPSNPQPVHTLLLIQRGIYIMESLDLEELAAAGAREFLFVALPLRIRGATGDDRPGGGGLGARAGGARAGPFSVEDVPRPEPGRHRGPMPGEGGGDLRHRPSHHRRRLPGFLA